MLSRRLCAALIGGILLGSCSGKAGDSTDTPTGTLTGQQRIAAIDAVGHKMYALTGADANARRQELLDYLWSRDEFEAAGESDDGSLWARFTDGRPLLIIANRAQTTASDIPATSGTFNPDVAGVGPSELPQSLQARVYLGGTPASQFGLTINSQLKGMLTAGKYRLAAGTGTIDDLKTVAGDGVFYMGGHGGHGQMRDLSEVYAVTSATVVSLANDVSYHDDWDHFRLAYTLTITNGYLPFLDAAPGVGYYAFNAQFVRTYFHFEKNSVVYLAACSAASPQDPEFQQAFLDQGAGVFWGWNGPFRAGIDNTAALFLFDRMLGPNQFRPENPQQRPFDYESIKDNLKRLNMDKSPYIYQGFAELVFQAGPNGPSGLLTPTIQYMNMDEFTNTLYVTGKFGTDQDSVEVNGTPGTIKHWDNDEIQLTMPISGAGAAGDVVVISKGRRSNPRRLTEWRATFTLSFTDGHGSLKWEGPIHLHFRADVMPHRDDAGRPVQYREVPFQIAHDSDGDLTASGSYSVPNSGTESWSGTSHLFSRTASPTARNVIDGIGEIDVERQFMRFAFFLSSADGMLRRVTPPGTTFDMPTTWADEDGPLSAQNPLPAIYMQLGPDFAILPDQRTIFCDCNAPVLKWNFTLPNFIPDQNVARTSPR